MYIGFIQKTTTTTKNITNNGRKVGNTEFGVWEAVYETIH
jgi:hypothetical protein